ncbi:MAG: LapA family protein [Rhodocyclaceae bacterium]|nr:LapA family protein [Rhodocyclaceae bacterium]MDZ4213706.1 LapA family protein [Rhodocyclaceae bacterium]
MHALTWIVRGVLFVILLGLAIKNSADVELRFFFDASWQAPLSLVVLITFATGVLAGLLAFLPQWIRQRRLISGLAQPALQPHAQTDKLTGR